jgi:hypothetical protein
MDRMDRLAPDVYHLHYTCNGRPYITAVNLSSSPYRFTLPNASAEHQQSVYFEYENVLMNNATPPTKWIDAKDGNKLLLRPHQTRTFMQMTLLARLDISYLAGNWNQSAKKEPTTI